MIFFNFWVGPEDDLGMVEAWLGGGWGVVRPMIPPLGGSIDFDTGNRFPLVPGARSPQKPRKIASKFWHLGVRQTPPPSLVRSAYGALAVILSIHCVAKITSSHRRTLWRYPWP